MLLNEQFRLKIGLAEMLKGGVKWMSQTPSKQRLPKKPGPVL